MRGVARAVVLLCAISAFGQACTKSETPVVTLPTSSWRPGDPGRLAAAQGIVEGSAREGCVWLVGLDGKRFPIVWPAGFYARFHPLRIYDGTGNVVAKQGQRIRVGGGQEDPHWGPRCMFGQQAVFVVQSAVTVVGP